MYHLPFVLILIAGTAYSIFAKKLTLGAAVTGALLGFLIYLGGGYTGFMMMTVFFISGTAASSVKKKFKEKLQLVERRQGQRGLSQVLANAGHAAVFALLAFFYPQEAFFFQLMIAACFASATSDTMSSELGNAYGSSYYNILTLKKDKRGLDGVISLEGSLFGLLGSLLIGSVYMFAQTDFRCFIVIFISGIAGNLSDSAFGAIAQRKGYLNNDQVNFLNTLTASAVAASLYFVLFL